MKIVAQYFLLLLPKDCLAHQQRRKYLNNAIWMRSNSASRSSSLVYLIIGMIMISFNLMIGNCILGKENSIETLVIKDRKMGIPYWLGVG